MALAPLALSLMFGAAFGSFLQVCADRLPVGKSILWPGSHCDTCQTQLRPLDLVPVLSYFWLRGRCRHCGASIPINAMAVEIVSAFVFGVLWLQATTFGGLTIYAIHASLLILVAVIDLKFQLILNKITYPWALLALATSWLVPGVGLTSAVEGGLIGLGIFAAIYFFSSGGMGLGDVKLAGVIGLILGLPLVLEALALAAVSGGVIGAALLLLGRKGRKDALPFGIFLAFGGIVTILWGTPLLDAYLDLTGWSR